MPRLEFKTRIVSVEDSAAILIPQEAVNAHGWKIGDELQMDVCGHTLTICTREEEARRRKEFEAATDKVFAERGDLLRRLVQSEREDKERAERETAT